MNDCSKVHCWLRKLAGIACEGTGERIDCSLHSMQVSFGCAGLLILDDHSAEFLQLALNYSEMLF